MQANTGGTQLTSLLSNEALSRLERLRINATRRFTNKSRGEHLAGHGGRSIEFSDYRDYTPGDDVRFVDWNAFARLNRPYMKLYHQEEEMHVVVLVDASASMAFEGKLQRAKQIGAAFGLMGLMGVERVSVCVFNEPSRQPQRLPPCTGRASLAPMLSFLEGIEGGGDAPVEVGVEALLKRHAGRGVAVLVSDFLTFGSLTKAFNLLFSSGLEVFAIQILGPSEINPEVSGDIRLVDCETLDTLDVSAANDLVNLYQEYRASYEGHVADLCQQRGGRFLSIGSQDSLDWVLFDLLRHKGWVK